MPSVKAKNAAFRNGDKTTVLDPRKKKQDVHVYVELSPPIPSSPLFCAQEQCISTELDGVAAVGVNQVD